MTKKERRKMKQAGIENFGKKRTIPSWLKDTFDDPADINWAFVDEYEKTVKRFMVEHGDQFCEFIKKKTGIQVYWTSEGKIYCAESQKPNISQEQYERMLAEFLIKKVKHD